ncbi:hypothetical protein CC86DRAFT_325365 [Ophiobolus disseminans]|uniref:F-box domain-containing protein n=1 Tax=Ophiobolus disseminans TaxID=1469910 RepID=A0A6A6ZXQ6_9PLEO|nr:hypothetical protein CC86DRAFT_325365 [Ophiobolus disseminans]
MDCQRPFPFMNLPIELRLMVYERLSIHVNRDDFNRLNNPRNPSAGSHSFAVMSETVELSILRTSRQVHAEATTVMQKKTEHILNSPPRLIVDLTSATKIHKCGGPLWHISHYLAKRAVAARKHLGLIPYMGTGMGASGARYNPEKDPDYPLLVRLVKRWFRSLEHQRASDPKGVDICPSIELALTAPEDWPHETVLHVLRQLAYVLFAEHGGFQFKLRNVSHLFPRCTEGMRSHERDAIDKVMVGRTGDVVRAVPGCEITLGEYEEDWTENDYALI